ncbi:MAG: hypothetical protein AB7S70_04505 [Hyphomicrobium sp.]|uniref:hypothetical protein n=1 Tax=Hyphomicrobium sp. TaxID=82 RepID=UPI003D0F9201
MQRLTEALGVGTLGENACIAIAYSIHLHNVARPVRRQGVGRPADLRLHILVDGLLDVLESEVRIDVGVSKRQRVNQRGSGIHVNGRIADFLRVIWDALEQPDRDADAFARLAANCAPVLGETTEKRRERRAQGRAPREAYLEWERNAWRRS